MLTDVKVHASYHKRQRGTLWSKRSFVVYRLKHVSVEIIRHWWQTSINSLWTIICTIDLPPLKPGRQHWQHDPCTFCLLYQFLLLHDRIFGHRLLWICLHIQSRKSIGLSRHVFQVTIVFERKMSISFYLGNIYYIVNLPLIISL